MTINQRARFRVIALHLENSEVNGTVRPEVWDATPDSPTAVVDMLDGLRFQTEDASIFRSFADAFTRAADSIDIAQQQLAEQAAAAEPQAGAA